MQLTNDLITRRRLCTLMITHNMKAALDFGSRTIMMHAGNIILDIQGEERDNMTVERLVDLFGKRAEPGWIMTDSYWDNFSPPFHFSTFPFPPSYIFSQMAHHKSKI